MENKTKNTHFGPKSVLAGLRIPTAKDNKKCFDRLIRNFPADEKIIEKYLNGEGIVLLE